MLATNLLFDQLDAELRHATGISSTQYEVLVRLSEAPDQQLRMAELAERSQSSRSLVSHTVARLERAGWVERRECPTDGRGAFAALTDVGLAVLQTAAPVHVESVRRHLFEVLDEEDLQRLGDISERLLVRMAAMQPAPPCVERLLGAAAEPRPRDTRRRPADRPGRPTAGGWAAGGGR